MGTETSPPSSVSTDAMDDHPHSPRLGLPERMLQKMGFYHNPVLESDEGQIEVLWAIPLHIEPHRLRDRLHEGPAILYRLLYFLIQTYTTQIIPATSQVARNEAKGLGSGIGIVHWEIITE
ncbi:unnamed protein product [Penicillium camemberti]|uniref:Str. FM013 n=1 Tax=Penicillium camemberti (strain FM 013) TaxID=1429867 RepID=A0A0G4NX91_PENC3|nr:unnamed protein product [Penicillium camemberti]